MLEKDVRFRKCKRCGKYFIMKGNYDTKYCDRVAEGETRTYKEARLLIGDYIHFYNYQRIQLKTKLTPMEFRSQFAV